MLSLNSDVSPPLIQSFSVSAGNAAERSISVDSRLSDSSSSTASEAPAPPPPRNPVQIREFEKHQKLLASIGYFGGMGVCGMILVSLGSTLQVLARLVDSHATQIGTVFLTRGAGALFGAFLSPALYRRFRGNIIIASAIFWIVFCLLLLSYVQTSWELHVLFAGLGFGTALTDTGCQIMTRKLHKKHAGPWLGANVVAFSMFGIIVPLIELSLKTLFSIYATVAAMAFAFGVLIIFSPDAGYQEKLMLKLNTQTAPPATVTVIHYRVEALVAIMVFLFIGCNVSLTSYVKSYVGDVGFPSQIDAQTALIILWVGIGIGRVLGVSYQKYLSQRTLLANITITCIGASISAAFMLIYQGSLDAIFGGIFFYGLFTGPNVGFLYDWNNRLTFQSELSTTIVMVGLNLGASFVPFIIAEVWGAGNQGPLSLVWLLVVGSVVPVGLLYLSKAVSYAPLGVTELKQRANSIARSPTSVTADAANLPNASQSSLSAYLPNFAGSRKAAGSKNKPLAHSEKCQTNYPGASEEF